MRGGARCGAVRCGAVRCGAVRCQKMMGEREGEVRWCGVVVNEVGKGEVGRSFGEVGVGGVVGLVWCGMVRLVRDLGFFSL